MKVSELRNIGVDGLEKELIELKREQFNLRLQHQLGQLTRNQELKRVRRDIARVKTVMNELEGATS